MGWSEKYWEDVKSELELSATESPGANGVETLGQPSTGQPTLGQPTTGQPTDAPEKD